MKLNSTTIFILIASASILTACSNDEEKKEEKSHEFVTLQDAERKTFVHKIMAQGNVETEQDVLLSAELGGVITAVDVHEGQKVSKGQVIAQIDASVLASNLAELQTQLEHASYMLNKQKELNDRGVGSEMELESAKTQVEALQASIKSLSTQKGKATITAPFSGVIDQVFAKKGQMTGPGTPIARLVNNDAIDIVASISEKHYANIKIGTDIIVSFPNYSDTTIKLKVDHIGNYIEPTNRTFRIISRVEENDYFLPNMLAEVSITDMMVDSALVIPATAILRDQENNDFVYVATEQDSAYKVKKTIVNVIQRYKGDAYIENQDKIKAGTKLVVGGARGIYEGALVKELSK